MNKKPTILLLSDDIRTRSGVATISRQLIKGSVDSYNWIQLGARIKAEDEGQVIDMSNEFKTNGNDDVSVLVYPSSGYGDAHKIRTLMSTHKIDAILHYTDPRYWQWLYELSYEIRRQIPIFYYHVWDNYPTPKYNTAYYKSCDLIMNISRQTHDIVKELVPDAVDLENGLKYEKDKVHISYVPHGINPNEFKPLSKEKPGDFVQTEEDSNILVTEFEAMEKYKQDIFGPYADKFKFIIFFNNRNIHRKCPSDLIYGYKLFMDSLSEEERSEIVLLLHTAPIEQFGTDLIKTVEDLCPDYPVYFSANKIETQKLNYLYNLASVTVSPSSAEGFGLSTAESIMAGTPMIATITGGLQDQMGWVEASDKKEIHNFKHVTKNSKGMYIHGKWAYPLKPVSKITGSPATPYIYDDVVGFEEISQTLHKVWENKDSLKEDGLVGRKWMLDNVLNSDYMINRFKQSMNFILENWQPIEQLTLIKFNSNNYKESETTKFIVEEGKKDDKK